MEKWPKDDCTGIEIQNHDKDSLLRRTFIQCALQFMALLQEVPSETLLRTLCPTVRPGGAVLIHFGRALAVLDSPTTVHQLQCRAA